MTRLGLKKLLVTTIFHCNNLIIIYLQLIWPLRLIDKNAQEHLSRKTANSTSLAPLNLLKSIFRANKTLDEQTRDRLLGYYYIILDESSQSLYHSPHLVLLPLKLLGWICYKIYPNLTVDSAKGFGTYFATQFDGIPGALMLPPLLVIVCLKIVLIKFHRNQKISEGSSIFTS